MKKIILKEIDNFFDECYYLVFEYIYLKKYSQMSTSFEIGYISQNKVSIMKRKIEEYIKKEITKNEELKRIYDTINCEKSQTENEFVKNTKRK